MKVIDSSGKVMIDTRSYDILCAFDGGGLENKLVARNNNTGERLTLMVSESPEMIEHAFKYITNKEANGDKLADLSKIMP